MVNRETYQGLLEDLKTAELGAALGTLSDQKASKIAKLMRDIPTSRATTPEIVQAPGTAPLAKTMLQSASFTEKATSFFRSLGRDVCGHLGDINVGPSVKPDAAALAQGRDVLWASAALMKKASGKAGVDLLMRECSIDAITKTIDPPSVEMVEYVFDVMRASRFGRELPCNPKLIYGPLRQYAGDAPRGVRFVMCQYADPFSPAAIYTGALIKMLRGLDPKTREFIVVGGCNNHAFAKEAIKSCTPVFEDRTSSAFKHAPYVIENTKSHWVARPLTPALLRSRYDQANEVGYLDCMISLKNTPTLNF